MSVRHGVEAWKAGDIEKFGSLIYESGDSSIYNYETGSEELIELHKITKDVKGIYGSRFSGAGFNGCSMAIVNPADKEAISEEIRARYLKRYPQYRDSFL